MGWIVGYAAAVMLLLVVLHKTRLPDITLAWSTIGDLVHIPLFGALALGLHGMLRKAAPNRFHLTWLLALAAAVVLALASEWVQRGDPGRNASIADVVRDVIGAFAALWAGATVGAWSRPTAPLRPAWLHRAGALVLVALATVPALDTVAVYRGRAAALPHLLEVDAAWTRRLLVTRNVTLDPTPGPGSGGLGLTFSPGPYATFQMAEPFPDWRGHTRIELVLHSALDAPVELTLRIHDRQHDGQFSDRFNRAITLRPGTHRISIPLQQVAAAPATRQMDLAAIRSLALFAVDPPHAFSLELVELRLR